MTKSPFETYNQGLYRQALDNAYLRKCEILKAMYSEECTSRPMTQEEMERYGLHN